MRCMKSLFIGVNWADFEFPALMTGLIPHLLTGSRKAVCFFPANTMTLRVHL